MLKISAALLLFLLFAFASAVAAQVPIRAKSEAGKDVILYPDRFWKYAPPVSEPAKREQSITSRLRPKSCTNPHVEISEFGMTKPSGAKR